MENKPELSYNLIISDNVRDKILMETCPSCGQVIQRWTYYGSVPICYKANSYELPDNCPKCGAEYPWKENK